MPQINLKQPGQPVADFSVSGAIVTIAGVTVDCAARQLDTGVTIEIRSSAGSAHEGGDGAYLAQIEIPVRRYTELETTDQDGKAVISRDAVALDPNAVVITLWPIV